MKQTLNEADRLLRKLHACPSAIRFLRQTGDPQEAWRICKRGDWMVWFISKQIELEKADIIEVKKLVRVLCQCVRVLSLPFLPAEETRPLTTIETVEAWTRGEASLEQVESAANVAACATADAAALFVAATTDAARAVYYTAYAVCCAACATVDAVTLFVAATGAAAHAAYAACAAVDDARRSKILKQAADIVRESYPDWPGETLKIKEI